MATNRVLLVGLVGFLIVVVGIVLFAVFGRPPQMGPSDEVFHTVDALYTAVRNRDEKRVTECEQRLHAYRAAGTLPASAADELDGIIRTGRGGQWQPAAEKLYAFMLAQRREGAETQPHADKPKAKTTPRW